MWFSPHSCCVEIHTQLQRLDASAGCTRTFYTISNFPNKLGNILLVLHWGLFQTYRLIRIWCTQIILCNNLEKPAAGCTRMCYLSSSCQHQSLYPKMFLLRDTEEDTSRMHLALNITRLIAYFLIHLPQTKHKKVYNMYIYVFRMCERFLVLWVRKG